MSETHVREQDRRTDVESFKRGRSVKMAPAVASESSANGNYGGVIGAVRKHLATTPILCDREIQHVTLSKYSDIVGRTLHFKSTDVIGLGAYARNGEYQRIIKDVCEITRCGSIPFFLLADFNATAEDIYASGLLESLDARIILPEGGGVTCHQGNGSLIDYMIVSNKLQPYLRHFRICADVP